MTDTGPDTGTDAHTDTDSDHLLQGKRSLRPLGGVLTAMAVSLTGTRISGIALPWFVLVATGSATRTGLVAFFEMAPYVLVKALAGPLVDKVGPRVVSWTADLASATAAAAVPVLHGSGLLSFPVLLALVVLIGAARGPGDLAKEVMVPEAADRGRVPLERATGLSGVIERLASTVGPAAGGTLIALVGPLTGLAVNAACFAAGSVIVALTLPRSMGRPAENPPPPNSQPATSPARSNRPLKKSLKKPSSRVTGSGSARAGPSCAATRCFSPSS